MAETPGEKAAAARARVAAKKATLAKAKAALSYKGIESLIPRVTEDGVYMSKMDPNTGTDRRVGFMQLNPKNIHGEREISMIQVDPNEQKSGIGSAMYVYAKKQGLNPAHSVNRTPAGEAFAKSTGDYAPPNEGPFLRAPRTKQEKLVTKAAGAQKAKQLAIQNALKKAGKIGKGGSADMLSMLMLGGLAMQGKYKPAIPGVPTQQELNAVY